MDKLVNAVIAEDNRHVMDILKKFLIRKNVEIVGEASDGKTAFHLTDQHQPQLLFVDIDLPQLDGLSLAKLVKTRYQNIKIIFTTGYKEYAWKAFEIDAIDYLVKPFTEERLSICWEKIKKNIRLNLHFEPKDFLLLKNDRGIDFVKTKNIVYITSEQRYTKFVTLSHGTKKIIKTPETLKSIQEQLDCKKFTRTHKSYIVNLDYVKRIEPSGQTYMIYFDQINDYAYLSKHYLNHVYDILQ